LFCIGDSLGCEGRYRFSKEREDHTSLITPPVRDTPAQRIFHPFAAI
jgi:hypothetical protein